MYTVNSENIWPCKQHKYITILWQQQQKLFFKLSIRAIKIAGFKIIVSNWFEMKVFQILLKIKICKFIVCYIQIEQLFHCPELLKVCPNLIYLCGQNCLAASTSLRSSCNHRTDCSRAWGVKFVRDSEVQSSIQLRLVVNMPAISCRILFWQQHQNSHYKIWYLN